ncbi:MAG: DUF1569 domain-containing protein [Bacteroidetes bacterium]|nr:DUF1569 domain-containing protein [Bacteroidota bacterium]
MKSILNESDKKELIKRISRLKNDSKKLWGKMSSGEMICHLFDQINMATGKRKTKYVGNKFLSIILKWIVLLGLPTPKGKVETVKELKQGAGGTKPTIFETDGKTLIELLEKFNENYPNNKLIVHPAFGKLNKRQWGRLVYLHTNYHLKQFGK